MPTIEKRALYNLLRLNWLNHQTTHQSMDVEPWQVEDYRLLTIEQLFQRLESLDVYLDKLSFTIYAQDCDSPEELTFHLIGDRELEANDEDHAYLLIFELWRHLIKEKVSLSIVCHTFDEQIYLYDQNALEKEGELQNALTQFIQVLSQNVDAGLAPKKAFQLLSTFCANDIETFLYDFISEQIDEENETYAFDLLEDFDPYLNGNKWFELLRIRLSGYPGSKMTQKLTTELIETHLNSPDLEFQLELLSILIERSDTPTFQSILKKTLPLITTEEEWQDLLAIGIDYLHRLDKDHLEQQLFEILHRRKKIPFQTAFNKNDADIKTISQIFAL